MVVRIGCWGCPLESGLAEVSSGVKGVEGEGGEPASALLEDGVQRVTGKWQMEVGGFDGRGGLHKGLGPAPLRKGLLV